MNRLQNPSSIAAMKRLYTTSLAIFLPLFVVEAAHAQSAEADRAAVVRRIDEQGDHLANVSQQIWEFAEVGYQETRSAGLLKEELRVAGFAITDNIAGIPTAFSA